MPLSQTIDIPTDRRLTVDVPREITGKSVILTFSPVRASISSSGKSEDRDIELFKLHADRLNAEAMDVLLDQVPLWNDKE